jgi:large subunit ribosomal protein L1
MELKEALTELRKHHERKFEQSVDLIINLKGMDMKRDNVNAIILLPHQIKEKKVCGFFKQKNNLIDTVTEPEFAKYKDKKSIKNLIKDYDFFMSVAPLMPKVATAFGKILGPAGKMPSPQLGIIGQETDESIKQTLDKISKAIKIRVSEPSIKVVCGKEKMQDEKIIENIETLFKGVVNALPKKIENVKNVMVKFTMTKPIKINLR